jgi:hypothetical protein
MVAVIQCREQVREARRREIVSESNRGNHAHNKTHLWLDIAMALLEVQMAELECAQHVRKQATRLVLAGDRAMARKVSKEIATDSVFCR